MKKVLRTSSAFLEALSTAIEEKSVAVPSKNRISFHFTGDLKFIKGERQENTLGISTLAEKL